MSKEKTNHILIPKHEKLTDKEKKEILDQYGQTTSKFPTINAKDAGLAGLNVKANDMIRIIRKDQTTNHSVYYRVVIDGKTK